ncbi:hypothetical protein E4U15_005404, partial [Claviceps sp. LM218 group G6]
WRQHRQTSVPVTSDGGGSGGNTVKDIIASDIKNGGGSGGNTVKDIIASDIKNGGGGGICWWHASSTSETS